MTDISYDFDGTRYPLFLDFIYNVDDVPYMDGEENLMYRQVPISVQCRLYDNHERIDLLAIGESHCNPLDNFDKKVGRKLAFQRAVEVFTEDPQERGKIWAAFMGKVKV